jgi:hypothetical protein
MRRSSASTISANAARDSGKASGERDGAERDRDDRVSR